MRYWLIVVGFAASGCFHPTPLDGTVQCGPGSSCPDGYVCAQMINACFRTGHLPDLGMGDLPAGQMRMRGESCVAGVDTCDTGNCVDGFCCDTACADPCHACNLTGSAGTCALVGPGKSPVHGSCTMQPASTCGTDGTCDGAGGCRKYAKGTSCSTAGCVVATNKFTPAGQCDGAGVCAQLAAYDCMPFKCKADGSACFSSCTDLTQCTAGNACNNMSCGLLPQGRSCTTDAQCTSGHCADGVCCDLACGGQCQACDVANGAGMLGFCQTFTGPAPHNGRPACAGAGATCGGTCSGKYPDKCEYAPISKVCNTVCKSSTVETVSYCDGNGACSPTGVDMTCAANFTCTGTMCPTGCTMPNQCQSGFTCKNMQCVPLAPVNTACAGDADCGTGNCAQGFCTPVSGPPNWIRVADMPTPRAFLGWAALPYPDGRILAFSGRTATAPYPDTNVTQAYSVISNSWTAVGVYPETTEAMTGATDGNGQNVLGLGGQGNPGGSGETNAYFFNKTSNAWAGPVAMPTKRGYMACTLLSNNLRVYCEGGQGAGGAALTNNDYYDDGTGWASGAAMPTGRYSPSVAGGADGNVYVYGGFDAADNPVAANQAFNPNTNSWATKASLPTPTGNAGGALGADGRSYIIGGQGTGPAVTNVYAYTPALDRWIAVDSLRAGARAPATAATGADGRIYVAGGYLAATEVYGPNPTLSTRSAAPGTMVSLSGNNFGANAQVTVTFNGVAIGGGATDGFGGLTAPITFAAPNVGAGSYKIVAVDNRSLFPVTLLFTIP